MGLLVYKVDFLAVCLVLPGHHDVTMTPSRAVGGRRTTPTVVRALPPFHCTLTRARASAHMHTDALGEAGGHGHGRG